MRVLADGLPGQVTALHPQGPRAQRGASTLQSPSKDKINKQIHLGPTLATLCRGGWGSQSKEKTAGHEPGAREGRADRTRGPDWPQGGQARFPLGSQGLFSGKPDLPLARNSKAGSQGSSMAKFSNKMPQQRTALHVCA